MKFENLIINLSVELEMSKNEKKEEGKRKKHVIMERELKSRIILNVKQMF